MNPHRLLVVEDDQEIRETLVELLEEQSYEVASAANGAQALKYLKVATALPCLILLDLMMPVMDGQAFREAQLQDPQIAHIPVVVVSAYRDVPARAAALNATAFLEKPPKLADLVSLVEQNC